jgi:hypothetical protein
LRAAAEAGTSAHASANRAAARGPPATLGVASAGPTSRSAAATMHAETTLTPPPMAVLKPHPAR